MGYILLLILNIIAPFVAVGVLIFFFLSPRRGLLKKLKEELRERFVLYPESELPKNAVWLHAASVGEVNSMSSLIPKLKEFYNRPFFITTNTWAGKVAALKNPSVEAAVLMPFDFYFISKKFVRRAKPYRMYIVEGELWPNTLMAAAASGAKVNIINGRMSPKSAKKYKLIRSLYSLLMSKITFGALQNEVIMKRYVSLGLKAENAYAPGNVKYDALNQTPSKTEDVKEVFKRLGWEDKTILACGSTHPAEEEMIFKALPAFYKENIRVVIAPRHLERKPAIIKNLAKQPNKFALLSQGSSLEGDPAILFADTMGWLSSFYLCSNITFVGGTITPKGGHNLLESAVLAKPVIFGPSVYNTPDTAEELIKRGGGIEITQNNFEQIVIDLKKDNPRLHAMGAAAKDAALSFQGATEKIMELVKKYERN